MSTASRAHLGISEHAQDELGEIIAVELPDVGDEVEKGQSFGELESVKTVNELIAPITGQIVAINTELDDHPNIVNEDPYHEGWLIEVELNDQCRARWPARRRRVRRVDLGRGRGVNGGRGPAFLATLTLLIALPLASRAATSTQLAERLQAHGIRDPRVLDAFRHVRREAFVPAGLRDHAYDDAALDVGRGQIMIRPFLLALMAEQLGLTGKERVLEIGTGSGYDAAVIAALAREVFSVEIVPDLAAAARLAAGARGLPERAREGGRRGARVA